jgi:signal transduction histidine kinase
MKPGIRASCLPEWLVAAVRGLLVCGLLAWCGPAMAASPVVHYTAADMLREEVTAFSPVTDTVDEAALPGSWQTVRLPYVIPKPAGSQVPSAGGPRKALRTTSWFRIRLDALHGLNEPTRFYLTRWLAAGSLAVYADGKLIYRSSGSMVWNLFNHPSLLLPLTLTADQPKPQTLLIRLDSLAEPEAAISSVHAGSEDAMISMATRRDWLANQLPFMCSAAFLAVGIFALGVWVFRRRTPDLLLFIIAATLCIRRWHFHVGLEKLPIPDPWFIWILLVALAWHNVALYGFMQVLYGRRQLWFNRFLIASAALFSVAVLPANPLVPDMLNIRPYGHLLLIAQSALIMVFAVCFAWRSRSFDSGLLTGVYILSFMCGLYDWARLKYVFDVESYYFTPYASMALFAAFVVILFRRYVGALGEIERVNASLAQRLGDREAELAASYERLRKVEQEQMLSNERQRMMQDMHDGLGSSLTSAIRSVEHGAMSDAEVTQVLKDCMDDLKLAIDSMEPTEADLLLLLATLRFRLAPRIKSAGVSLVWEVQELPALDWLDPSAALHILRVVQESVANILRHTRASEIRVRTASESAGVQVIIEDNGQGFDVEKALGTAAGRGLSNQQRRAQAIGGTVGWQSGPAGTRFTLWLPLRRAARTAAAPHS